MSNKRQKARKERKRKEQSKNRVQRRREAHRSELRQQREEDRLKRKFAIKQAPIRNTPESRFIEEEDKQKPAPNATISKQPTFFQNQVSDRQLATEQSIKERLKHNMEILEALESAMQMEEDARNELQTKLEDEGHETLREKMDAIGAGAEEIVHGKQELPAKKGRLGGTANARMIVKDEGPSES